MRVIRYQLSRHHGDPRTSDWKCSNVIINSRLRSRGLSKQEPVTASLDACVFVSTRSSVAYWPVTSHKIQPCACNTCLKPGCEVALSFTDCSVRKSSRAFSSISIKLQHAQAVTTSLYKISLEIIIAFPPACSLFSSPPVPAQLSLLRQFLALFLACYRYFYKLHMAYFSYAWYKWLFVHFQQSIRCKWDCYCFSAWLGKVC